MLTFLKNQYALNGQKQGNALNIKEFGWGVKSPLRKPIFLIKLLIINSI